MYSVEEFLEQADQASDADDDLERVVEQIDESRPHEDEAEEATETTATKVAKKVRKTSNRPKLDAERLKGPRGLATIEKLFTKIKFQGNGHEQDDLQAVMKTLHYWCHRLFPKYSFDDCLEHLERLGSKKPIITLKKKILFDLFEEDQPIVNDADEMNPDTQEAIDKYDLLLQQEPINPLHQRTVTPERIELTEEQKEMIERNRLIAAERRKARLEALQQKQNEVTNSTVDSTCTQFTEEQKLIIERNRQQALERRRAKNNTNISITTSMVPSSQDLNSTVTTVINSQKSDQSVNFNELVDSFFPVPDPEDNSQKSDEGVDINDLIEEMNTTEEKSTENIIKPIETNKEIETNEDDMDINDLIEDNINCEVTESSITELNQSQSATTTFEDKMDVDNVKELKKTDNLILETSYDLNSTKEDTIANLLEME